MRLSACLLGGCLSASLLLFASSASADSVLLLPAKGQVAGSMLSSILETETRYAVLEAGHKLIPPVEMQAAMLQVSDGNPDNSDEFAAMGRFAKVDWVLAPTVFAESKSHRLELIAFQVQSGRSESVARDIDTEKVHAQVLEMLRVLLRAEGVGTGALPWEAPPPQLQPGGKTKEDGKKPEDSSKHRLFFVGAGLGFDSAISQPSGATGSSTALSLDARAGVAPIRPLEIALELTANVTNPRAIMLDVSGRYLIPVAGDKFRIGPEVGPGLFIAQGGSKETSFMLRATAAASYSVSPSVSIEAQVGDLRWVPLENGTLVLAGVTAEGVFRF